MKITNRLYEIFNDVVHAKNTIKEKFFKPKMQEEKIIISCDASITVNPGGDASVGFVIEHPDSETLKISKAVPSKTINQAEYDAVYEGLTTLFNLRNNTDLPVEVRSDSKLVIKQLNGEWQCKDQKLENKRQLIKELVKQLPTKITFVWLPRNSTPGLKLANDMAQDYLGIKNH